LQNFDGMQEAGIEHRDSPFVFRSKFHLQLNKIKESHPFPNRQAAF